jgi:beta-galactosidase
VLATFFDDYFAGAPALTVNAFGQGKAYYIAARTRDAFLSDIYTRLVTELSIEKAIDADLPSGVTAQLRTDGETRYVFLMNFNRGPVELELDGAYRDMLKSEPCEGTVVLEKYGVRILTIEEKAD